MKLSDALQLKSLSGAKVVAGACSLDRFLRWVHVVDLPDPTPWIKPGDFMLTTGYSWPREEDAQQELIRRLAEQGLAGLGFAVPNFFDRIPDNMIQTAEELRLPLVEIPWETPFSSITEEIHGAVIAAQYEMLEKSETFHQELMRAALDAESLQDIAARLGKLIDKPLLIAQPDGALLAQYMKPDGQQRAPDFGRLLKMRKNLLKSMRENTPLRLQTEKSAARIWPIHIKKELVGLLCVYEDGSVPLTELEARSAEYATLILAIHISWQRQLASLESQLGYSFLESLKEGVSQPTPQMVERAEILGFDPNGSYRMGLISLLLTIPLSREGILKRERFASMLRSAMLNLKIRPLLSIAQNQITFLIPEEIDPAKIWEPFRDEPQLLFAVSRPHSGFSGVHKGYAEIASMLPHLTPGRFLDYDELLVPRLLLGEEEARQSFMEKMFRQIAQTRNGDVLVETLIATAKHNFQLKKTAEHLNIHPKTLRYRLDKAVSIAELDLNDPETQFQLQLAARISSLTDKR